MKTAMCQSCGQSFEAERATARYCSNTCRQRAHYQRQHPEPGKVGRPPKVGATATTARKPRGPPAKPRPSLDDMRAAIAKLDAMRNA